ncbi:peptidase domain-containing ABC transporter [Dysgonomonas capnocytophagoides]|uniref:Peptidase domain-containing ABC transporter n=1 Tax=Dysgonomonas capnocytophagoides TaxID=45254 RepID=A0A4Y8KXD7_9BACT|nr:peptidase domain-containing ABC transporter [Dysgonomonas capnocytophagoides]TFD94872.1 peptidase domain-containing ABC transporter [Dysgonomonas capnocytophagoides]
MRKFPHYKQHDAMDCGPTCLRMIAAFYGRHYSLERLRLKSRITKEGVSLLGVSEAAESLGFRTMGVSISFEQLCEAPLPCIVFWNQQHFVVVYDIKKHKNGFTVYVADPAGERLKYTQDEFCRNWISTEDEGVPHGIALLLEPSPEFYSYEGDTEQRTGFRFLFSYLKPYKKMVVQLILGLILGSLLLLILPFLSQAVVDIGISTYNLNFVYLVLAAQLVLTFSNATVQFIRGWILLHLGSRINIALISDYLIKLTRMPMGYFDTKMVGDILQRINDHTRIQDYLTNSSLNVLFSFFNIVILGLVLAFYSLKIFAIFIIGSLLYFLWVWLFMKKRAELDHKNFAQQSANQSTVIQLITGMQEIKLNACEQQKRWGWEAIQARLFRIRVKGMALSQYQDSGAIFINQTKNILITALVAKFVIDGEMTIGMMVAVQYIIGQLNSPVDQIIEFARKTQDARLSLDRLSDLQTQEDEATLDDSRIQEIPSGKNLLAGGLYFAYDGTSEGIYVLNDVGIMIPSGKKTAIVGTSGSGKTTLLKLFLGYYPPQKGIILLGENRLDNYSRKEWRSRCGIVMQEGFIFSDSIARNIAPAAEIIDKERLLMAATMANLSDFIDSLPLGYNTKIGNDGHGLSQGQKQRILIARAIYKDPEFVFLDEATNALDANNEKVIMENLNKFFKGRTSIIVAHRLSTVRDADQIIVLDKGKVVEVGTHDDLSEKKGAYYHLVKNQLEL